MFVFFSYQKYVPHKHFLFQRTKSQQPIDVHITIHICRRSLLANRVSVWRDGCLPFLRCVSLKPGSHRHRIGYRMGQQSSKFWSKRQDFCCCTRQNVQATPGTVRFDQNFELCCLLLAHPILSYPILWRSEPGLRGDRS